MCSFLAIHVNELNLAILLAYRPPPHYSPDNLYHGTPLERSFNNIILDNITKAIQSLGSPAPDILLLGDFNFPNATWREGVGIPLQGNAPETRMLNNLIELCDLHNLLQVITFGTRAAPSGEENILDLVFTNNHDMLSAITKQATAMSDHYLILGDTKYHINDQAKPSGIGSVSTDSLASFNLHKANWDSIKNFLSAIDWEVTLNNKTNAEIINIITAKVYEALDKFCPRYKNPPGKSNHQIPRERRILFRQRKRKLKALRDISPNTIRAFRINIEILDIEQRLINSLRAENSAEEARAVENIKTNPKFFFSYANKNKKAKSGIGPLKVNGKLITTPVEISECLSTQYASVYSTPDPSYKIDDPITFFDLSSETHQSLVDIEFDEDMIEKEIDTLRMNSAAGPDQFPAMLLKTCKKELRKPILILWKQSLTNNDIAAIFKHAITHPALKPNSESYLPKSYRPISLTSHIIKIFEKIIRKAIVKHLSDNNLLPANQHGFVKGSSTVSQLINQTESIIRILESGSEVDTIYLDFAKAFDKVDHYTLCKK